MLYHSSILKTRPTWLTYVLCFSRECGTYSCVRTWKVAFNYGRSVKSSRPVLSAVDKWPLSLVLSFLQWKRTRSFTQQRPLESGSVEKSLCNGQWSGGSKPLIGYWVSPKIKERVSWETSLPIRCPGKERIQVTGFWYCAPFFPNIQYVSRDTLVLP